MCDVDSELIARIRLDLPDWPAAVTDIWLANIAVGYGWPPTEKWHSALRGKPFADWHHVTWQEAEIELTIQNLTWDTRLALNGIYEAAGEGAVNAYSNVHKTKERLRAAFDYVFRYGTYPSSIILARRAARYEVLDGYHRLAALFHIGLLREQFGIQEEAAPIRQHHSAVIATLPVDWDT